MAAAGAEGNSTLMKYKAKAPSFSGGRFVYTRNGAVVMDRITGKP